MSIHKTVAKIKHRGRLWGSKISPGEIPETLLIGAILILVGTASFGLGQLSAREGGKPAVTVGYPEEAIIPVVASGGSGPSGLPGSAGSASSATALTAGAGAALSAGAVVGSKNSDKYHFPWCSGAARIKESNKVVFASIEEARAAGYVPAGNCKGLE